MKKNILLAISSFLFMVFVLEVAVGYSYFQRNTEVDRGARCQSCRYSALYRFVRSSIPGPIGDTVTGFRWPSWGHSENVLLNSSTDNPFVSFESHLVPFLHRLSYHPFINFSGAYGNFDEEVWLDYFGFRNDDDLYFQEGGLSRLVVITGGSEAAGFSHRTTIAENLESLLRDRSNEEYTVLNLAMNSYVIADEINSYVNLAYHLKPEYVIAHSAHNDFYLGQLVPDEFRRMGLNYNRFQEFWLPRLYDLDDTRTQDSYRYFNSQIDPIIVDAYLRNVDKYRTIVQANSGTFILGIQASGMRQVIEDTDPKGLERVLYETVLAHYDDVAARIVGQESIVDFTQMTNLTFVDAVHTNDESSIRIAETYAQMILKGQEQ